MAAQTGAHLGRVVHCLGCLVGFLSCGVRCWRRGKWLCRVSFWLVNQGGQDSRERNQSDLGVRRDRGEKQKWKRRDQRII